MRAMQPSVALDPDHGNIFVHSWRRVPGQPIRGRSKRHPSYSVQRKIFFRRHLPPQTGKVDVLAGGEIPKEKNRTTQSTAKRTCVMIFGDFTLAGNQTCSTFGPGVSLPAWLQHKSLVEAGSLHGV